MTMKSLTKPLILMIIAILLLTGCATTQNNASNDTGVAVSATETQPANPDQVAGAPPVGRPPQGGSSGSVDGSLRPGGDWKRSDDRRVDT